MAVKEGMNVLGVSPAAFVGEDSSAALWVNHSKYAAPSYAARNVCSTEFSSNTILKIFD